MHQTGDRALEIVADGIVEFLRAPFEFARIRRELTGDGVGGVGGVDKRR